VTDRNDAPVSEVLQMRVALTAANYAEAVRFYRDVLGLEEREAFSTEHGNGVVLDAGEATLEILDERHAAFVDAVEVGERVAGPLRIAFEVTDVASVAAELVDGGATEMSPAVVTPWGSVNSRLEAPEGMQLTIFGPG